MYVLHSSSVLNPHSSFLISPTQCLLFVHLISNTLLRPPPPPPPFTHHFHYHYNIHFVARSGSGGFITGINEVARESLEAFQPEQIPFVPANHTFIYNHTTLLHDQPPFEPPHPHYPWEIQVNHDYLHVHYHHFGDGYNWDDDFNHEHLTNHIPPNTLLSHIENLYPVNYVVHSHIHYHQDGDPNLWTSSSQEEEENEEGNEEDQGGQEEHGGDDE